MQATMEANVETQLVAGQPIKYRYSGQTENGAKCNKALFAMMNVNDVLKDLLRDKPNEFLATYSGLSDESNGFLRAVIGSFSQNSFEGEFDEWYKSSSPEVKTFFDELGLEVKPIEEMGGQFYVIETHAFGTLPEDLPLPESIQKELAENAKRIDEDRGVKEFTYGIMHTCNEGYKDAKNFQLGDWHSWATFGGLVISDPTYSYEVVPITKDELLGGLQGVIDSYEPAIESGDLCGAVEARKQFFLEVVYDRIKEANTPEEIFQVFESDNLVPSPGTGVYVLISNKGSFAVKADPKYDENTVAGVMSVLNPEGHDGIGIMKYQIFEVPQKALDCVPEYKTLEVRLS